MQNKKVAIFLIVVIVVILAGLGIIYYTSGKNDDAATSNNTGNTGDQGEVAGVTTQDSSHDPAWIEGLAKALTAKGAVMYGAYWCPHCNNQKEEFGDAKQYIDYVECDASGPNANPDECKANDIQGYPTWIIDGQHYSGEQSLEKLAQIIGYNQ